MKRRWVVKAYDPNGTFVDRASFRRYWTRAGAERFARRMRTEGRPVLVPMIVDGTPDWTRQVPLVNYRVEHDA